MNQPETRSVFVAGTDTDAGKTVLAAALVAGLRSRGIDAGYLKPVSSDGVEAGGRLVSPDALWVARSCGLDKDPAQMNPVCVPHALTPLAATRLEGQDLDWTELLLKTGAALQGQTFTVCEGVGGLLAPICPGLTCLDLMAELKLPVVLAARPGLGTINHTCLSVMALRRRGLRILGFVFTGPEEDPSLAAKAASNSRLITEFCGAHFLGALPRLEEFTPQSLAQAASGLDLTDLME